MYSGVRIVGRGQAGEEVVHDFLAVVAVDVFDQAVIVFGHADLGSFLWIFLHVVFRLVVGFGLLVFLRLLLLFLAFSASFFALASSIMNS